MSPYELDNDERNTIYTENPFVCKGCGSNDPWHKCEEIKQ